MSRCALYRWLLTFFVTNTLIISCVAIVYFPGLEVLERNSWLTSASAIFSIIYFLLAFFAQVSLFMLPALGVCILFASCCQKRWLNFSLAAFFVTVIGLFFAIEALLYTRLYHMHYVPLAFRIYQAGAFSEVLPLNFQEWLLIAGAFIFLFLVFVLFSYKTSRICFKCCRWLGVLLSINIIFVYATLALATNHLMLSPTHRMTVLHSGRIAPYLTQIYQLFFVKNPEVKLNYPRKPLRWQLHKKPFNIVIIAVDAWRYNTMNNRLSPHINQFAQQAVQFTHHYSGGNCTQSGLFSLFYGIPPTYWQAFVDQKRSPLLLDVLQQQGYQTGFFLSATPRFPEFDRSIFAKVRTLPGHTLGDTSLSRDAKITEEMVSFIKEQTPNHPFFAFMFYDSLHNYCETAMPDKSVLRPYIERCNRFSMTRKTESLPYLNRYNNKVRYIDSQVNQVLQALKQKDLLSNTIVILTADHGEQMNDQYQGLWGHASAYNDYQLRVPLIVYWPGLPSRQIDKITTHYDLPVTLMKQALGVRNAAADYAVGQDLLATPDTDAFIAASYGDYAMIHFPQVYRIYPDGDYGLLDLQGKFLQPVDSDQIVFRKLARQLTLFTRKD